MHVRTVLIVIGTLLGIAIGYTTAFASEIAIASIILGAVQGVLHIVERKRKTHNKGLALSLCLFLFSFGITIGILRVQLVDESTPYVCATLCTFEGVIISSPESKDTYQTIIIRPVESGEVYDIQIRAPLYPKFRIRETLQVTGKATIPNTIFPHGDTKSFDYATYLHTKHIGSEMFFPKIEVIDSEAHTMSAILGRWKEDMSMKLYQYVSSPASSLASGMLFGDSSMSKDLNATFRIAGLSHIVVLSGFNIAIVIGFALFVFALLPLIMRVVFASILVLMFVVMVGGEASVLRATAMAFVALLSTLVGRAYVARQALIISLFAIVMYEPNSLLHDVSLHLSFLATAGIVYLSEPIHTILTNYISRTRVVELCTTTLAAYVATLPYVMYTFGTVSVYALVANILALPLVPIAMLFSFLVVVASYISHITALVFGYVDSVLISIILFIAKAIEELPFSSFVLTTSFMGMLVLYLFFVSLIIFFSKKEKNETLTTTEAGYLTEIIKY